MEYKYEKLTDKIYVCASSDHRFGTDAFLLADFSQYRAKDKVCDLGTGCGIIPLIMQKKMPPQVTYAVDIQEGAIEQLRLGLEKSEEAETSLQSQTTKIEFIETDVDTVRYKLQETKEIFAYFVIENKSVISAVNFLFGTQVLCVKNQSLDFYDFLKDILTNKKYELIVYD